MVEYRYQEVHTGNVQGIMGYWKNKLIEWQGRRYGEIDGDKFVCDDCVADADLKQFIKSNLDPDSDSKQCSYCGRLDEQAIAIPVYSLLDEIADAIFTEHEEADGSLFDTEDDEWIMPTYTTDELFRYELEEWPFNNEDLAEDIIGAFFVDPWCERSPLGLRLENTLYVGWREFSNQIKHVTRYLFFMSDDDLLYEGFPPGKILAKISELVDEHGLIQELAAGTQLFRGRHTFEASPLSTVEELGAPTIEQARASSRMSAAGIPVFYAAFERDTAMQETLAHVKETGESRKVQICWGTFETKEPMQVLDLRRVPDKPGLFSIQRAKRPAIGFLRHFAEEIAKPIPIDGLEHIEYTPTQAVAEFFRHVHRTPAGDRVQGIIYPSAIADGTSCVLFFGAKHCCSLQDGWHKDSEHQLGLLPESIGSITFETKWVAM